MKKILAVLLLFLVLGSIISFAGSNEKPASIARSLSTMLSIPAALADSLGDGSGHPPPPIPRDP